MFWGYISHIFQPKSIENRYAKRYSGHFQNDTSREASYDVFCNSGKGNEIILQEIHARCK